MKRFKTKDRVICENSNSMFNYFAWPTVGRLPDGTLAMVCSGFRLAHICPFGKGVICYSKDEGKTWTKPAVVIDTPEDDRDCGIVTFGSKVMVNTFNNGFTTPMCKSWMGEKEPNFHYHLPMSKGYLSQLDLAEVDQQYAGSLFVLSDDGYEFGAVRRCPVQSPHGPCVMHDGRLFFVGKSYGNSGICRPGLECYTMDPEGKFEYVCSIPEPEDDPYCEPHAIVLDDRILVQIRTESFTILQCESFDGGRTFTQPHGVGVAHGSPPHLVQHSSGVLISSYGARAYVEDWGPNGQRVMLSYDKGETWDVDYILRDDGPDSDLGYPATVELKDGSLLTVYYQKRSGEDHCVIMQSIWHLPE